MTDATMVLVHADERVVLIGLLVQAWERITAQANLSDEDAALANELKAAFEGPDAPVS